MDINILLALQDFRNTAGSFLTDFFVKMTFFGELNTAVVILALIYWCVSKELGTLSLLPKTTKFPGRIFSSHSSESFSCKLRGIEEVHIVPPAVERCRQNPAETCFIEFLIVIFSVIRFNRFPC